MKLYLIAGEASGDLHGSNLIKELIKLDPCITLRGVGGDLMQQSGMTLVQHYKQMAYMGFVQVIRHLPSLLKTKKKIEEDLLSYQPDKVILIDYPGFNLEMAQFVKKRIGAQVYYYIAPKVWASREKRVQKLKLYVDQILSILPFEKEYFAQKGIQVAYVGNPSLDSVQAFLQNQPSPQQLTIDDRTIKKPIIALLCGSRKQEIKENLPIMLEAVKNFPDFQAVIAGAPGRCKEDYLSYLKESPTPVLFDQTYELIRQANIALVTSGTATLETALFKTPQVVCYRMTGKKWMYEKRHWLVKTPFISLVNLIAGEEVVKELILHLMTASNLTQEMNKLLSDRSYQERLFLQYQELKNRLGEQKAAQKTAAKILAITK